MLFVHLFVYDWNGSQCRDYSARVSMSNIISKRETTIASYIEMNLPYRTRLQYTRTFINQKCGQIGSKIWNFVARAFSLFSIPAFFLSVFLFRLSVSQVSRTCNARVIKFVNSAVSYTSWLEKIRSGGNRRRWLKLDQFSSAHLLPPLDTNLYSLFFCNIHYISRLMMHKIFDLCRVHQYIV